MRVLVLFGYVLVAAPLAWCAWCALAPRRFPPRQGYLRWAFSFVVSDVPSIAFYVLIAATASVVTAGPLDSPIAWLALGVSIGTAAALGVILGRQRGARTAVSDALTVGLGEGWQDALDADAARALRRPRLWWLVALLPMRVRRRDVVRIPDIAYGDAGIRNTLDVYRHRSRPVCGPVLIHLHGGSLRRGRKNRQGLPLIYDLAASGWLCISANYRLQPAVTFPEHLIDVKKVIAWARAEGEQYGADPAIVFVAGGSSGAQLAALAALTANDPAYQRGFEDADTSVAGAIALYGYYGPVSIQRADAHRAGSLPVSHLRADAPPFFVAHGDRDTLTSALEATHFAASLRRVSASPVVYAELAGAQHGFDTFRSMRSDAVVRAVKVFASWVLTTTTNRDACPRADAPGPDAG
ncbi:MAG: alpha/beta hydrolase [Mycobacteriales bacterium]